MIQYVCICIYIKFIQSCSRYYLTCNPITFLLPFPPLVEIVYEHKFCQEYVPLLHKHLFLCLNEEAITSRLEKNCHPKKNFCN